MNISIKSSPYRNNQKEDHIETDVRSHDSTESTPYQAQKESDCFHMDVLSTLTEYILGIGSSLIIRYPTYMARIHAESEIQREIPQNPIARDGSWMQNLFDTLDQMLDDPHIFAVQFSMRLWLAENPDAQRAILVSERELRRYLSSLDNEIDGPILDSVLTVAADMNNREREE